MIKKLAILTLLATTLITSGTAAITQLDITNTFPDSNIRETGTVTTTRIESDSTTETNVQLWLEKPDNTITQINNRTTTVRSGNPREITFTIPQTTVNQYGEYTLTANETSNNNNHTLNLEIAPKPSINVNTPEIIYPNEEVKVVQVSAKQLSGDTIPFTEIETGNITAYYINDDLTTTQIEKNKTYTSQLVTNTQTQSLEAPIDIDQLEEYGNYEVLVEFNISSCNTCKTYEEIGTATFLHRQGWDRLTYQNKWGMNNITTALNNQAQLDNEINQIQTDNNDLKRTISQQNQTSQTTQLWRILVLMLVGLTALISVITG